VRADNHAGELQWLVRRADEAPDLTVFGYALLEHLAVLTGAELASLLLHGMNGQEIMHYCVRVITPVELAGLHARVQGLADVDASKILLQPFRLRTAAGTLYLDPLPSSKRPKYATSIETALTLLDLLACLAASQREAAHDALTGLMNRRSLADGLGSVIEQGNRYGTTFSLAMIDLNNFKWFNDTYGHAEGDLLLRQLAQVLGHTVRRADLVARYGGDEFLLVLPHTEPDQTEALLKRVAAELDQFLRRYDTSGVKLGFSSGVSHYPADGRDADSLIRRADERLYQVKEAFGR
jgi:diguanylate cyclase (GGDEF)-like protein